MRDEKFFSRNLRDIKDGAADARASAADTGAAVASNICIFPIISSVDHGKTTLANASPPPVVVAAADGEMTERSAVLRG